MRGEIGVGVAASAPILPLYLFDEEAIDADVGEAPAAAEAPAVESAVDYARKLMPIPQMTDRCDVESPRDVVQERKESPPSGNLG